MPDQVTLFIPAEMPEPIYAIKGKNFDDTLPLYGWSTSVNPDELDLAVYADYDCLNTQVNQRATMIVEATGAEDTAITGDVFLVCDEHLATQFLENDEQYQINSRVQKAFHAWVVWYAKGHDMETHEVLDNVARYLDFMAESDVIVVMVP